MTKITPLGIQDISAIADYKISVQDGNAVHSITYDNGAAAEITFFDGDRADAKTDGLNLLMLDGGGSVLSVNRDAS